MMRLFRCVLTLATLLANQIPLARAAEQTDLLLVLSLHRRRADYRARGCEFDRRAALPTRGGLPLIPERLVPSMTVGGLSSDNFGAGGRQGAKESGRFAAIPLRSLLWRFGFHDTRINRDVHIPSACAIVPASCIGKLRNNSYGSFPT
jgi:hypothetical protein